MVKFWLWMQRRLPRAFGVLSTFLVSVTVPHWGQVLAVQLGDGSTVFTSPPRLVSFVTTENIAGRRNARYYVTVNLLPEADESLKTLTITLIEGRFPRLGYHVDELAVFAGDRGDRGDRYPIETAAYDEASQTLTLQLEQPIPPGELFTVTLEPIRNPTQAGVYLFEVMAAPAGEKPVFQRVGTGRLDIYEPIERFWQ